MDLSKPKTIRIGNEKEAITASIIASEISSTIGFDKLATAEVTLAVSEIAGNAIKFAGKGVVIIKLKKNRKVLEIIVHDRGPGIKDVKKVMSEGYSTVKGSLGAGLKAAKRAMDEFFIMSKVGKGTKVVMRKYLPIPEEEVEYGVVSLPDERYTINGDAYVIKEFGGDKVLLAIIDGVGEGEKANKVANAVKDFIEENYKSGILTIMTKLHKFLIKKTPLSTQRGVAMALFLLKPYSIEYVGVGDTSINVWGADKKIVLWSREGIIGGGGTACLV